MQKYIIVIPVYNAVNYIGTCLDSVLSQKYNNYEVVIIDDCSIDGTWGVICKYPFHNIRNLKRIGSGLANIMTGIKVASNYDVIITLDGDDYFSDEDVLVYLNEVYKENVWMTYGQYRPVSGKYENYCQPISDIQNYRKSGEWKTTHLRTFKKWLFDKIKDEDLRDEKGEYFKVAWDRAFMYPMIEMAGKHLRFISKILYVYNDLNPACDMTMLPAEALKQALYIINKPCYGEI